MLVAVPGCGLLIEEGCFGLSLGAAMSRGFLMAEHFECLFWLAEHGEGAAGLALMLPNSGKAPGCLCLGLTEIIEEVCSAAEHG